MKMNGSRGARYGVDIVHTHRSRASPSYSYDSNFTRVGQRWHRYRHGRIRMWGPGRPEPSRGVWKFPPAPPIARTESPELTQRESNLNGILTNASSIKI